MIVIGAHDLRNQVLTFRIEFINAVFIGMDTFIFAIINLFEQMRRPPECVDL